MVSYGALNLVEIHEHITVSIMSVFFPIKEAVQALQTVVRTLLKMKTGPDGLHMTSRFKPLQDVQTLLLTLLEMLATTF